MADKYYIIYLLQIEVAHGTCRVNSLKDVRVFSSSYSNDFTVLVEAHVVMPYLN